MSKFSTKKQKGKDMGNDGYLFIGGSLDGQRIHIRYEGPVFTHNEETYIRWWNDLENTTTPVYALKNFDTPEIISKLINNYKP